MHGKQKLSPLDFSAGIVAPPTHNHRLPYVSSLSTNLFRFTELPQFLRRKKVFLLFTIDAIFSYTKCMERRSYPRTPPGPLCRDCDTTFPYPTISLGIYLVNKHALPWSITEVKAKYNYFSFHHRFIFPIRNAWNTGVISLDPSVGIMKPPTNDLQLT